MSEQIPELWWSPTMGAIRKFDDHFRVYGGGTGNYWGSFVYADFPADAVRLVAAPPAPRVFFPGDDIPGDLVVVAEHGVVYAYDAAETTWDDIGGPVVDIPVPTTEGWQAAVDRARAERGEA